MIGSKLNAESGVGRRVGVGKLWHKAHEEDTKNHKAYIYNNPGLRLPAVIS